MKKNVILTGIKPTGIPHIGNYLGMLRPAIKKANDGTDDSFFFIADYHALTTVKDAKLLRELTRQIVCVWLACGLDPKKTVFYRQSQIKEIPELSTILMNVCPKGLIDRAHAFKAATADKREINMGIYTYPILMSADILAYNTNLVPVGEDQKQHCEIAADIATAFNAVYGQTFVIPQADITKSVALIEGLDGRKMSKSYGNTIPLFCDEDELLKCVKKITTDNSAPEAPKPKTHLIFKLFSCFAAQEEVRDFENEFDRGIGWFDAKRKLFEVMNKHIKPMREKYNYYMSHFEEAEDILRNGAIRARLVAAETLERVRKAVGI
jgi:tryptophanyl-tRNA synthetase